MEKRLLMGSETEYAVCGVDAGRVMSPAEVAAKIFAVAPKCLTHMADLANASGMYLEN